MTTNTKSYSRHETAIRQELERRGLKLTVHGKAWRLSGDNVDVLVADISNVTMEDLRPGPPGPPSRP